MQVVIMWWRMKKIFGVSSCTTIFLKVTKLTFIFIWKDTIKVFIEFWKLGYGIFMGWCIWNVFFLLMDCEFGMYFSYLWIGESKMYFLTYGLVDLECIFLTYGLVDPECIFWLMDWWIRNVFFFFFTFDAWL